MQIGQSKQDLVQPQGLRPQGFVTRHHIPHQEQYWLSDQVRVYHRT